MKAATEASEWAALERDGSIIVPAERIAAALGLAPNVFMLKLRGGFVSQRTESGVGEDEGRHRVTFAYRNRTVIAIVDATGEVTSCEPGFKGALGR